MALFDIEMNIDNVRYIANAAIEEGLNKFYWADNSNVTIGPSKSSPEGLRMTLKLCTDKKVGAQSRGEHSFLGGTRNEWWVNYVTNHNATFIEKANKIWIEAGYGQVQITGAGVYPSTHPWLEFAPIKKDDKPYDPDAKVLKA